MKTFTKILMKALIIHAVSCYFLLVILEILIILQKQNVWLMHGSCGPLLNKSSLFEDGTWLNQEMVHQTQAPIQQSHWAMQDQLEALGAWVNWTDLLYFPIILSWLSRTTGTHPLLHEDWQVGQHLEQRVKFVLCSSPNWIISNHWWPLF